MYSVKMGGGVVWSCSEDRRFREIKKKENIYRKDWRFHKRMKQNQ